MSAGKDFELYNPSNPSEGDVAPRRPRGGQVVRLASRRLPPSVALISARGDVDASNTAEVTDFTLQQSARCRGLVLDLRDVDFFGTEGFTALHRISVNCAQRGTSWAIVRGVAARRVLEVCDPDCSLPVAETLTAAHAMCTLQRSIWCYPRPA